MQPFSNPQELTEWVTSTLGARGIDEIAEWRMTEYWFQVELFRAAQSGQAGCWQHIGNFEHPYYTAIPKSGSKSNTKWIDLVFGDLKTDRPEIFLWCELKDLGRSPGTAKQNVRGLGADLAALWALDVKKTKDLWLNPSAYSMDRGRLAEWNEYGESLDSARHLVSQISLCHKSLLSDTSIEEIKELWLNAFVTRTGQSFAKDCFDIATLETKEFVVFGLLGEPAYEG